MDRYKSIIDLPHHVSTDKPRMSLHARAAQFEPYAALSGYGDAVVETARLTSRRIELCAEEIARIDGIIGSIAADGACEEISVTYFVADARKGGGESLTVSGEVGRIDPISGVIVMIDGRAIPMTDIIDIVRASDRGREG